MGPLTDGSYRNSGLMVAARTDTLPIAPAGVLNECRRDDGGLPLPALLAMDQVMPPVSACTIVCQSESKRLGSANAVTAWLAGASATNASAPIAILRIN